MRPVDHFAADGQYSRVGLCFEGGDNFLSMADVVLGRREGGVDDVHLGRVDRELAGEALAPCSLRFLAETLFVAEVGEDPVDRLNPGRGSAGKAERAGELVREGKLTRGIELGRRAERGR